MSTIVSIIQAQLAAMQVATLFKGLAMILVVKLVVHKCLNRARFSKAINKIPGPTIGWRNFLLGNLAMMTKSNMDTVVGFMEVVNGLTKLYPLTTFKVWIGYTPFVVVHTADAMEV